MIERPEPVALLVRFGEIALEFTLEVWIARQEQAGAARSEIGIDVYRRLREAGIEILVALPRERPATDASNGGNGEA